MTKLKYPVGIAIDFPPKMELTTTLHVRKILVVLNLAFSTQTGIGLHKTFFHEM